MRRMLIIGIVSLALGVILGLTVPALSVEPEAAGLSVTGSEGQMRHGVAFVPGPVDRAEPVAPDAGSWKLSLKLSLKPSTSLPLSCRKAERAVGSDSWMSFAT